MTDVETPLSKLSDQQSKALIEVAYLADWSRARTILSRLGLPASEAENLLAWTIRALRKGEISSPQIEKPLTEASKSIISAWRCDISLPKHLRMQILWRLRLPNGQYVTLQLSVSQFHKVRYNLAVLLKEMLALKNSAICQK